MKRKNEDFVKLTIRELEEKALELGVIKKPLANDGKVQLDHKINKMLRNFAKHFELPFVIIKEPTLESKAVTELAESARYAVWIKIDETLPWIELKGIFKTKKEARKAAKEILDRVQLRIVEFPKKSTPKEKRRLMKALAPARDSNSDIS